MATGIRGSAFILGLETQSAADTSVHPLGKGIRGSAIVDEDSVGVGSAWQLIDEFSRTYTDTGGFGQPDSGRAEFRPWSGSSCA